MTNFCHMLFLLIFIKEKCMSRVCVCVSHVYILVTNVCPVFLYIYQ